MAHESNSVFGSGIQVLRHTNTPPLRALRGTNSVVINPEDIAAGLGILQADLVQVSSTTTNLASGVLPARRQILIRNESGTAIGIGPSGTTFANAYPLLDGEQLVLDILGFASPFAITASATLNINVLQLA